ncbi:MAG: hypothetical protein KDA87_21635, partial [Planctomycetales bacterium]|nr:hypothetical protein [Planctomycetales bacterium]
IVSDYANGEARDISNNLRQSFEVQPWAVGQLEDVPAGTVVSGNSTFEFSLDLSQAHVRNYVDAAIESGALFLGISSLHSAAQDGPVVYPSFYLDAGGVGLGPTATLEMVLGNALPGDFNSDGLLSADDIDQLFRVIQSGIYSSLHDVNGDQTVDDLDRDTWIQDLRQTWAGDANLDGTFDSADLVQVFQASQFEDSIIANSTWETGDWTGDGEFDSSDLVYAFQMGGYQDAAAVRAVPEPNAYSCVGIILVLLCCRHSAWRSRSSCN